ncbi:MAG: hypothetical protein ACK5Y2_03400 [Bdellovibrionales bacterium]
MIKLFGSLVLFAWLAGCAQVWKKPIPSFESRFNLEIPLEKDRQNFKAEQDSFYEQVQRIDDYFGVHDYHRVKIEVRPFSEKPFETSCARIYGPYHVYAHSPGSYPQADGGVGAKLNAFCTTKKDSDLIPTLLHEYVHGRQLLLVDSRERSELWIWEGVAGFLSGEVRIEALSDDVTASKKSDDYLDVCAKSLTESQSYRWGPRIIAYLEKQLPGIGFSLSKARNLKELTLVLKERGISCLIPREILETSAVSSELPPHVRVEEKGNHPFDPNSGRPMGVAVDSGRDRREKTPLVQANAVRK